MLHRLALGLLALCNSYRDVAIIMQVSRRKPVPAGSETSGRLNIAVPLCLQKKRDLRRRDSWNEAFGGKACDAAAGCFVLPAIPACGVERRGVLNRDVTPQPAAPASGTCYPRSTLSRPPPNATACKNPPAIATFFMKWIIWP